jgi:hypothetical protein
VAISQANKKGKNMKEFVQYTIEIKKEFVFYLLQEKNQNHSSQIKEIFNPDDFWLDDEETFVRQNGSLGIHYLQSCNSKYDHDFFVIENNELVELEDSEEIIQNLIEEKILKEKEQEFLKNQLKLKF